MAKWISFESLPFFKMYSMRDLEYIMRNVRGVSQHATPHKYQKIYRKLKPTEPIANSYYRGELIPLVWWRFNNQNFSIRAYRMRGNDYFKIEITFSSDTLGEWKYLDMDKCHASAVKIFDLIWGNCESVPLLGNHIDDYFFYPTFKNLVGVLREDLSQLKECDRRRTKEYLKEEFKKKLLEFQEDAKIIAWDKLDHIRQINTCKQMTYSN